MLKRNIRLYGRRFDGHVHFEERARQVAKTTGVQRETSCSPIPSCNIRRWKSAGSGGNVRATFTCDIVHFIQRLNFLNEKWTSASRAVCVRHSDGRPGEGMHAIKLFNSGFIIWSISRFCLTRKSFVYDVAVFTSSECWDNVHI